MEEQLKKFELAPDLKMQVVAVLDDLGGKRYFLKAESGEYLYLDQELDKCTEVNEAAVASAVIKHGYRPVTGEEIFEFGKRKEILKSCFKSE